MYVAKGTFAWDTEARPTLIDIDLRVPVGDLVAVVGQVGTGEWRDREGAASVFGTVDKAQPTCNTFHASTSFMQLFILLSYFSIRQVFPALSLPWRNGAS